MNGVESSPFGPVPVIVVSASTIPGATLPGPRSSVDRAAVYEAAVLSTENDFMRDGTAADRSLVIREEPFRTYVYGILILAGAIYATWGIWAESG
jgi:hypothetical protein